MSAGSVPPGIIRDIALAPSVNGRTLIPFFCT